MGYDFYYAFRLNVARTHENVKTILEYATCLGYTFRTPFSIHDKNGEPFVFNVPNAVLYIMKEHEKSRWAASLELFQKNEYAFDIDISEKEKKLTIVCGGHYQEYKEMISQVPKAMEILRPFKIDHFELVEEYFTRMWPTPDHDGPMIWTNLKSKWPIFKRNLDNCGYKLLDAPNGNELVSVKVNEYERAHEFTAYLRKNDIVIKAVISGGHLILMPLKPYVQYDYQSGKDIDTAYYLNLLFNLAEDALALDLVEAKNF